MLLLWFCRTVFCCKFCCDISYYLINCIFDFGIIALCTFHLSTRGVHYWSLNEFVLDLCWFFSVWELQKCFTLYCCYFVISNHIMCDLVITIFYFVQYVSLLWGITALRMFHSSTRGVHLVYWSVNEFVLDLYCIFSVWELQKCFTLYWCYFVISNHIICDLVITVFYFVLILVVELSMNSVSRHFSVWELRKYFTLHCWYFVFSINLYAI